SRSTPPAGIADGGGVCRIAGLGPASDARLAARAGRRRRARRLGRSVARTDLAPGRGGVRDTRGRPLDLDPRRVATRPGGGGPADASGLQRWAGVGREDAVATVASLERELVAVDMADRERWVLTDDAEALASAVPVKTTRLLPLALDPYLQADRDLILPDPAL